MSTARDETLASMKRTGRVTLKVEEKDGKVFALGDGGLKFTLSGHPEQKDFTTRQILNSPMFKHDGRVWRGRYYKESKTAHFQRKAAAPPKPSAKAKARTATKRPKRKATAGS